MLPLGEKRDEICWGVKGSFTEYVRTKQVTYARHYPRTDNDLSLETSPGKLNMSKANKPNQTTYT